MKSIIQNERECFICGRPEPLEEHHCLEGAYRGNKKNLYGSEKYGLTVYLCTEHHMMAHEHEEMLAYLRSVAQKIAMQYYGWTTEEFIKRIGRSFI